MLDNANVMQWTKVHHKVLLVRVEGAYLLPSMKARRCPILDPAVLLLFDSNCALTIVKNSVCRHYAI